MPNEVKPRRLGEFVLHENLPFAPTGRLIRTVKSGSVSMFRILGKFAANAGIVGAARSANFKSTSMA
jgi:hypothetical protein